ncbi:MAG: hypothetical protein PHN64_07995 [Desulfovibrionaceae bacterium]|nr:hypothetical protein [Desulfovibrionaceae bacterium]
MSAQSIDWEEKQRFFVPNEDAAVARMALRALPTAPHKPVFVAGSGMLALDMLPDLPNATLTCIDLSSFQTKFVQELLTALQGSERPEALRIWFQGTVFPQLQRFYSTRGQGYALENVLHALDELFHIRFFRDAAVLKAVRARLGAVQVQQGDMVAYLCHAEHEYDFVHLSNIVDYLPIEAFSSLFRACAARRAPVMYVQTTACREQYALNEAWQAAGYVPHPCHAALNAANHALGAQRSARAWMRTGIVRLLVPAAQRSSMPTAHPVRA